MSRAMRFVHKAALLAASATWCGLAAASDDTPHRPPLAEPLFTETVTDIDGYEPGEVEFDVNGSEAIARRNGARLLQTSVEVEWKVWSRLGVRLEPSFTSARAELGMTSDNAFGFRGAAGWNLIHDFANDFHLQVECGGRFVDDTPAAFRMQPGESPLPLTADLKAAWRLAGWTLRGSLGFGAGGTPAHVPIRGQIAVMRPFSDDIRFGFFGLEADADFARANPLVIAPNIWADVTPIGIPGRIGLGIPFIIGAHDTYPAAGVYIRLLILTSREASFEKEAR